MHIIDLESDRPYKSMTKAWIETELIDAKTRIYGATLFLNALEYEKECRKKEQELQKKGIE